MGVAPPPPFSGMFLPPSRIVGEGAGGRGSTHLITKEGQGEVLLPSLPRRGRGRLIDYRSTSTFA